MWKLKCKKVKILEGFVHRSSNLSCYIKQQITEKEISKERLKKINPIFIKKIG